ncbi:MAG TPA: glycoside hydrolase family 11 protein [Polyangiaceae bacterium]|nr:glycoside hydrolase family 11 protein [Polyangiaceae bacterium]
MKISPVSPMRTKLLKTFVLGVAFGMVSCGLEDNLSEVVPEGDTGNATGGKSTGGAASTTRKSGTGGSSKNGNATGGKASASTGGSDSDSNDVVGVGGANATGKSSTTRGSASTGGAKATGSGGASNADDTGGESGSNASPKGGSNGQGSSTTRTTKAAAGGTGNASVPMGGAKSNSAGGAGNTSSNGGTKATSSGGSGNTGNGGASTGGSKAATGGAATGGVATGGVATGGSKAATGGAATGGVATGGKPATGGAATGGAPTTTSAPPITGSCSEGQKALTANGTGTHCGYTYEYWKDQGTGTLTLKADGFSVDWSNINNLLGRKGVRPGTGNEVVAYEADYQPNGNSYLCIYGWFKNPLVEYYIVDSWGTWRPPGGQGLQGTVTCDGATYDIYKLPRTGPSIEGDNTSFTQYFNVRQQKRTSGTINVGCHIASWKAKGMSVGSFYEVSMTVEGYQSSGKADVKFSMK